VVREQGVINTRYRIGSLLVARRTKEAKVALFPYSWIGHFWKELPFLTIIPISFSDTKLSLYLFPSIGVTIIVYISLAASPTCPSPTSFIYCSHPYGKNQVKREIKKSTKKNTNTTTTLKEGRKIEGDL
jgi:hypothetical protein